MKLYQVELFSTFAIVFYTVRKFKITYAYTYIWIATENTNRIIQRMFQFYRYTHTHNHEKNLTKIHITIKVSSKYNSRRVKNTKTFDSFI